jgi:hypothetical protein
MSLQKIPIKTTPKGKRFVSADVRIVKGKWGYDHPEKDAVHIIPIPPHLKTNFHIPSHPTVRFSFISIPPKTILRHNRRTNLPHLRPCTCASTLPTTPAVSPIPGAPWRRTSRTIPIRPSGSRHKRSASSRPLGPAHMPRINHGRRTSMSLLSIAVPAGDEEHRCAVHGGTADDADTDGRGLGSHGSRFAG